MGMPTYRVEVGRESVPADPTSDCLRANDLRGCKRRFDGFRNRVGKRFVRQ